AAMIRSMRRPLWLARSAATGAEAEERLARVDALWSEGGISEQEYRSLRQRILDEEEQYPREGCTRPGLRRRRSCVRGPSRYWASSAWRRPSFLHAVKPSGDQLALGKGASKSPWNNRAIRGPAVAHPAGLTLSFLRLSQTALSVLPVFRAAS